MPVFNGAGHMERALDSLLAQTMARFTIVISDNGSDDGSQEIAAAYAEKDARVTAVTHSANRGASWNFERVFRLAGSQYFAWTAADDYWDQSFLAVCVRRLDDHPDAVTCVPGIQPVTPSGEPIGTPYNDLGIDGESPRARWRAALHSSLLHSATYGVMRTTALARTRLLPPYIGSDHVMMTELALQGRILQVPETLAYKTMPPYGAPCRTHAELVRYLGGRGGAPWLIWLRMTGQLVGGARHVRPVGSSTALLSADAVLSYFSTGGYMHDVKHTARRLLPKRERLREPHHSNRG